MSNESDTEYDSDESEILIPLPLLKSSYNRLSLVRMPISSKIRIEKARKSISPLLYEDEEETYIEDEMQIINNLESWGKDILKNDVAKIEEIIENHSIKITKNNYEDSFKKRKPELQLVTESKKPKQINS
tara:strand:+ start:2953 stop:3342 length:390 start_codon:yes stop_codon:yes gene_type:complete